MESIDFGKDLMLSLQNNIIKGVKDIKLLESYNQPKVKIPEDIVQQAFSTIDKDKILAMVREQIEEQIAKTIVGQLLTETATDTKKIMNDQSLRQQIKNKVYPEIIKMVNGE